MTFALGVITGWATAYAAVMALAWWYGSKWRPAWKR